jgi:hypothetical protein
MKKERKQPTIDLGNGEQKRRMRAIENEFSAECLVRFQMRGRQASAFMLQSGPKGSESLRFVFGWDVKGVHTTINPEQEDAIFDALEAGLKGCDLHLMQLKGDRKSILIELIPELTPTSRR